MHAILIVTTLVLFLSLLGGCGGGSAQLPHPSPLPPAPFTKVCGNGSVVPETQPCRGRLTLPGIDNIPLTRISRTNAQMQELWAVTDYYSAINGSREHGRRLRRGACWSYILECDDPDDPATRPFAYFQNYSEAGDYAEIDYADAGLAPEASNPNAWFKREIDNTGARVASVSIQPDGRYLVGEYGDSLDFLVVHSTGNVGSDDFPVSSRDPLFSGIRRAVEADKAVYVAGYRVNNDGDIVRHPRSSGCDAVSDACVWVPFVTPGVGRGTSFGAPRVAAALASVLAVFPNTTHQDLARLLKTSTRKVSTLPNGLGVVDFTRLTTLDASGEWRLVTGSGGFNDAVAPLHLNDVTLPGNAAIASSFALSADGEAVTFATELAGTFTRTAPSVLSTPSGYGMPIVAGVGDGLSLRLSQPNGDVYAGGVYEHEASRLFAAAGVGVRNDFFGLDERHGYGGTLGYEANLGHRNLFFRLSRQETEGGGNGLVRSARGEAIGFTARRSLAVAEVVRVEAALSVDKFTGGEARTVFGTLRMAESDWSRTAAVHLTYRPGPVAMLVVGGELFRPASGGSVWTVGVRLDVTGYLASIQ